MNVITLDNTLPRVFAGREAIPSDVWQCPLSLHRGTVYLVTAESGSGKSSLCAYLYGYRKDYSGTIAFDGRNIDSLSSVKVAVASKSIGNSLLIRLEIEEFLLQSKYINNCLSLARSLPASD